MKRTFLSTVILLLFTFNTSIPIMNSFAQVADNADAASKAILEAETALGEAEKAIISASNAGADVADAKSILQQAQERLTLARSRVRENPTEAFRLATEARDFAVRAKAIAIERERSRASELRGKLLLMLEELEVQRRELMAKVERITNASHAQELKALLGRVGELVGLAREVIGAGNLERAEVTIHQAQSIIAKVRSSVGSGVTKEDLLRLLEKVEVERRELLGIVEKIVDNNVEKEELRSILRDLEVTIVSIRENIASGNLDGLEQRLHGVQEVLTKVRSRIAQTVVEIGDARGAEVERKLHFLREKLAAMRRILNEKIENGHNVDRAKTLLEELSGLVRDAALAFEQRAFERFNSIFQKAAALIDTLQTLLETKYVSNVAVDRIERYIEEVKGMIAEAKKNLGSGKYSDERKAEAVIAEAEKTLNAAVVAYREGRKDLAFSLLEDTYHLLKRGLDGLSGRSSGLNAILERIERISERIGSIGRAVAESLDRAASASVRELLGEIRSLISMASREVSAGNPDGALKYLEEAETLVDQLLEKISSARAGREGPRPIAVSDVRALREDAVAAVEKATRAGINTKGLEALISVGDDALAKAEAFNDEGNPSAAESLASVAERVYAHARELAEHLSEVAEKTEANSAQRRERSREAIRIDRRETEIEVGAAGHRAKISSSLPRITYEVDVNGIERSFSSAIRSLVEFEDRNGDGKMDGNEEVQRLDLDQIEWVISEGEELVGGSKVLKITYSAQGLNYAISLVLRVYESGSIEFFRSDEKTVVYSVDGGAKEVKFDLIVTRWPWQSNRSMLLMRMNLEGEMDGEGILEELSQDESRLVLRSAGVDLKVKWITKATLQELDGLKRIVDIRMFHRQEGNSELKVDFVYSNFNGAVLIHDPSIGLLDIPEVEPIPEPGQIVAPRPEEPGAQVESPEMLGRDVASYLRPEWLIPVAIGVMILGVITVVAMRRSAK